MNRVVPNDVNVPAAIRLGDFTISGGNIAVRRASFTGRVWAVSAKNVGRVTYVRTYIRDRLTNETSRISTLTVNYSRMINSFILCHIMILFY